ncbi:hypothetical protein ACFWVC_06750 [Streptomyces sp. NPDC058691]|uniref:hypothetical protein n=1 Tax=Streptomyces sp. NPDC058691 TaxID=3346601 RepID=UPI0036635AF9
MSRETDRPSPGHQGRGGAAYPSGTPPYGTRPFPSLHPQEGPRDEAPADGETPAAPAAGEPRTETTLTTRVRINIPGSRPIPPVVVRTTVDGAAEGEATASPAAGPSAEPAQPPAGWTAGGDNGALGAGQPEPSPAPAPAAEPEAPAQGAKPTSDWFAPRKAAPAPQAPEAAPPAPAPAPGPAQDFAAPEITQPLQLGDLPSRPTGQDRGPGRPGGPGAPGGAPRPGIPYLTDGPMGPGGPGVPGPRPFPGQAGPGGPGGPGGFGDPAGPGAPAPGGPGTPFRGFQPPAGPTAGPVTGDMRIPPAGPAGAPHGAPSPSPFPTAFPPPGERLSGDTVVSGIPAVPPGGPQVTRPVPAAGGDAYHFQEDDEPAAKPKGRSKLILAGVAVVVLLGIAYTAGLLMDHSDVPAGTTVYGVEIGGKSKDEAAAALDAELGPRKNTAITVTVGDQTRKLKPSAAGLVLDTDATVRDVAHRDYNPVTVIGSLFGGTRDVDPVVDTDKDKLRAQLEKLSDGLGGAGSEGKVTFVSGKAVAVAGKPHQAIDVAGSVDKVTAAYGTQIATGKPGLVTLAATTVEPKVTQAALDEAVKGFGKTAMSGFVYVKAGGGAPVPFSPERSLSEILSMVPDKDGNLTPYIDTKVLKGLYGGAFDGVLVTRGDGSKTAVTPQDVASAMLPALRTDDPSKKTVTVEGTS